MQSGEQQRKGPETDPKDRGRLKRLQRQVRDIMGNDAFVDAIVEAATDGKAMAALKANPRAHLKGKRITVPDELDVEFSEESPWCIGLCYSWWIFRFCCWACI